MTRLLHSRFRSPLGRGIAKDAHGRVSPIAKTDYRLWALPEGGNEVGASLADTVIREAREEPGYHVEIEALTGTYAEPRHVMADGEVRQQFLSVTKCNHL